MKPAVKYFVIHKHREQYPVQTMCKFFEVSRSGYYKYVHRLNKPAKDFEVAEKIRSKREENSLYKTYGYRRMKIWLASEQIHRNPKTVLRIMHKYDMLSEIRRRKRWVKKGE